MLCSSTKIHKFTPFVTMNFMQALPQAISISINLQCHTSCVCIWVFFCMVMEWSTRPKNRQNGRNYYILHIVLEQRNRKWLFHLCSILYTLYSILFDHYFRFALTYSNLHILFVCVIYFFGLSTEYQTFSATILFQCRRPKHSFIDSYCQQYTKQKGFSFY